jgi:hypothetical protein
MSNDLGLDRSGNGNNWTANNLAASDQMVDTPTNNFPTIVDNNTLTLKEGNLNVKHRSGSYWDGVHASMGVSSGKWYWEIKLNALASTWASAGQRIQAGFVGNPEQWPAVFNSLGNSNDPSGNTTAAHPAYMISTWDSNFTMYGTATYSAEGIGIPANNDILNVALDLDNNKAYFGKNGTYYDNDGSTDGNPSTGANPSVDAVIPSTYYPGGLIGWGGGDENELTFNFGQDSSFAGTKTAQGNQDSNEIGDFYNVPPSGFLALCTANLADPTVIPSKHFNTVTYSGDSNSRDITGVGFQPDFTWIKQRGTIARRHHLQDSVRGAGKSLFSNDQTAEETSANYLTSFNTDGFSLGTSSETNGNSHTYVAWNWKAGGTAVSNTNGSITSSVSANVDTGFSIIQHSGNATANATYGHGLSKAPEIVISKKREDNGYIWHVFVKELGASNVLRLDTTAASHSEWEGHEAVTNSVIQLSATASSSFNAIGKNVITYAWHSVDGYSKVGSYTGNGSADGPYVHTGFRPAYVMVKRTDSIGSWCIVDTERPGYNGTPNSTGNARLRADTSGPEDDKGRVDILSNGFKPQVTYAETNASGANYIFIAFAEQPFKHSNAR